MARTLQTARRAAPAKPTQTARSSKRRAPEDEEMDDPEQEEEEEEEEEDDEAYVVPPASRRRGNASGSGTQQTYSSRRGTRATQGGASSSGKRGKGRVDDAEEVDDDDDGSDLDMENLEFSDDENGGGQMLQALTQAARSQRKGKKSTQSGEGVVEDDEEDAEEMDAMEEARRKMQTWKDTMSINHPLDEDTMAKVAGELTKDHVRFIESIENTVTLMTDCAGALEEFNETKEEHPRLKQIDKDIKELIDAQYHAQTRSTIIEKIKEQIMTGEEEGMDIMQKYLGTAEAVRDAYKTKTSRKKYANNEMYEHFKILTWESASWRGSDAMPALKQIIPAEEGDEEEEDDDMEMGGITINYKCPITQALLEDPVQSKVCGHYYSSAAIRAHLKGRAGPCPVAGCPKSVPPKELMKAPLLAKRVAVHKRKLRRQEEELAKQRSQDAELID